MYLYVLDMYFQVLDMYLYVKKSDCTCFVYIFTDRNGKPATRAETVDVMSEDSPVKAAPSPAPVLVASTAAAQVAPSEILEAPSSSEDLGELFVNFYPSPPTTSLQQYNLMFLFLL